VAEVQKAKMVVPVPTLHFSEGAQAGRTIRLDADVRTTRTSSRTRVSPASTPSSVVSPPP